MGNLVIVQGNKFMAKPQISIVVGVYKQTVELNYVCSFILLKVI